MPPNVDAKNKYIYNREPYMHGQRWHGKEEKVKILEQYAFSVILENANLEDYVTEKVWQALLAGSVPIYLGAPNIDQFLPVC